MATARRSASQLCMRCRAQIRPRLPAQSPPRAVSKHRMTTLSDYRDQSSMGLPPASQPQQSTTTSGDNNKTSRATTATSNGRDSRDDFFLSHGQKPRRSDNDPSDIGRTLRLLTNSLPTLLKDGALPSEILAESISLELLPSTLNLPDIRGKTVYAGFSKLATWSVRQLWPDAQLVVVSQRLVGSARRLDRLVVKFRIVRKSTPAQRLSDAMSGASHEEDNKEPAYSGVFHFYFDERGRVCKHVFEVTDQRWSTGEVLDWLLGRKRSTEAQLGLCFKSQRWPS